MNFSGISRNSLLGSMLRFPLRLIPPRTQMPVLQGPIAGSRWIVGASNHGCWLGSYEYEKSLLFASLVRPGMVFYDVGAHVGYYTLLGSKLVGPQGRVVAFEPLPQNLEYLQRHLAINHTLNASVVRAAVSSSCGTARFAPHKSSSMGSMDPSGQLTVRTVALDDLWRSGEVPVPDVIKVDVEGAEAEVLLGASALISECRPVMLIATHGKREHEQSIAFLRSAGYSVSAVAGGPVEDTDEILAKPRGSSPPHPHIGCRGNRPLVKIVDRRTSFP